jgi:hypothetical protein
MKKKAAQKLTYPKKSKEILSNMPKFEENVFRFSIMGVKKLAFVITDINQTKYQINIME